MQQPDDGDEFKVHVYLDSPEWDRHAKWFMMPSALLRELYVTTYVIRDWSYPCEKTPGVQAIRKIHPGCVLVY